MNGLNLIDRLLFPGRSISEKTEKIPIEIVRRRFPALVVRKNSPITVLFFHGNGETIYDVYSLYQEFKAFPFNFVCPEYQGYGVRDGQENEKDCIVMAEAIFNHVKSFSKVIYVVGYSIGSGPACHIAHKNPTDVFGLVLVNPFLSVKQLAIDKFGIVAGVIKERFNNSRKIRNWLGKTVIICGKRDAVIPHVHSVLLYQRCPSKDKKIIVHENERHTLSDWNHQVLFPVFKEWLTRNEM